MVDYKFRFAMAAWLIIGLGGLGALGVVVGPSHSCAITEENTVKCWGAGHCGQLGQENPDSVIASPIDTFMRDMLPPIDLGVGKTARLVVCGSAYSCALLNDLSVKCWGCGLDGQLGQGSPNRVGDKPDEMGDHLFAVDLGRGKKATDLVAGFSHTCALIAEDGSVKCWGLGQKGQLGQGRVPSLGVAQHQMGDFLPPVDLGSGKKATQVVAGDWHTCARLGDNSIKCWGHGGMGQLGQGNITTIGLMDKQMGDYLPIVDLGALKTAKRVRAGSYHTCAVLYDNSEKCWGAGFQGQLGWGSPDYIGGVAFEMGDNLLPIDSAPIGRRHSTGSIAYTSRHLSFASATTTASLAARDIAPIQGSFTIVVSNASQFVQEPNVVIVLTQAIAGLLEVNVKWVPTVRVQFLERRLSSGRFLTQVTLKGNVRILFDVMLPPQGHPDHVQASVITDRFLHQTLEEATAAFNGVTESSFLGSRYRVEVTFKKIQSNDSTESPSSSKDMSAALIVVLSIVCCCLVAAGASIWYLRRCRSRRQRLLSDSSIQESGAEKEAFVDVAGPLGALALCELVAAPRTIAEENKEQLYRLLSTMLCNSLGQVNVFISYALGHRDCDCVDTGPGLYYVAALVKALYLQGVRCIVPVPRLVENRDFLALVRNHQGPQKWMLVVETRDYFSSTKCLQELHAAQENDFEFRRIRFDDYVPNAHKPWPHIEDCDVEATKMLRALENRDYFDLPLYPEPPSNILQDTCTLSSIAMHIGLKMKLTMGPTSSQENSDDFCVAAMYDSTTASNDGCEQYLPYSSMNDFPSMEFKSMEFESSENLPASSENANLRGSICESYQSGDCGRDTMSSSENTPSVRVAPLMLPALPTRSMLVDGDRSPMNTPMNDTPKNRQAKNKRKSMKSTGLTPKAAAQDDPSFGKAMSMRTVMQKPMRSHEDDSGSLALGKAMSMRTMENSASTRNFERSASMRTSPKNSKKKRSTVKSPSRSTRQSLVI